MLIENDFARYNNTVENDWISNPKRFWNYASIEKYQIHSEMGF